MHLCDLFSFSIHFFVVINLSKSQDPPEGECQIWGDPHLLMFPVSTSQENMRMSYWCQAEGQMLILKNKYIEVTVNVTKKPHWNEYFEIKLFADPAILCTITPNQNSCTSIFLEVKNIGSGLDITYYDADNLRLTVNSYMNGNNRTVYDLVITQSYKMILASSGACVTRPRSCSLENSVNPFGKRRKRNMDLDKARGVCDKYMNEAYRIAKETLGNNGSSMTDHARAACVNDVSTTGDSSWGKSAITYVTMNALKKTGLKGSQRREKMQALRPAVERAISRLSETSQT